MTFDVTKPPAEPLIPFHSTSEPRAWKGLHPDEAIRRKFYEQILHPNKHMEFRPNQWVFSKEYIEALKADPKSFQAWLKIIL